VGRRSASPCQSQSGPSMSDRLHVALIDDDAAVLDALSYYLARQAIRTSTFQAAKGFLDALDSHERFDCIVSDVRMPGMSGLDLMKHLNERGYAGPVILITGHGDVDMAVGAIKNGAFDFIEKPFDEARLLASVRQAAERMRQSKTEAAELDELQSRFESLSARQREVMELAIAGLSSKEIGIRLNISPKTVENHRAWVMERMGARNVADLIRKAMKIRAFGNRFA
jgi:RNA polymerase sigma factor (sigma-70 family)